jgi:sec-independent protein translocase protein TatC
MSKIQSIEILESKIRKWYSSLRPWYVPKNVSEEIEWEKLMIGPFVIYPWDVHEFFKLPEVANDDEMTGTVHLSEVVGRLKLCLLVFILVVFICLGNVGSLVRILQAPAEGIKFMQLGPGEYLGTSIKVSLLCGGVAVVPCILSQILLFCKPGLLESEKIILPVIASASLLFNIGLYFHIDIYYQLLCSFL